MVPFCKLIYRMIFVLFGILNSLLTVQLLQLWVILALESMHHEPVKLLFFYILLCNWLTWRNFWNLKVTNLTLNCSSLRSERALLILFLCNECKVGNNCTRSIVVAKLLQVGSIPFRTSAHLRSAAGEKRGRLVSRQLICLTKPSVNVDVLPPSNSIHTW